MKNWFPYSVSASVLGGLVMVAQGQNASPAFVSPQNAVPQAQVAQPANNLNYNVNEVIKLNQSGVGSEVICGYISNSNAKYQLSANDIVYLHQLGIAPSVISAMILHDQQMREATPAPYVAQAPAYVAPAPAPAPAPIAQPAPVQTVVQQAAPTTIVVAAPAPAPTVTYVTPVYASPYYAYPYPYYGRPYGPYYGPAVNVGVGFGFGRHSGLRVGVGF